MRKQIEKIITREVISSLEEVDIAGILKQATSHKKIHNIVKNMVREEISYVVMKKLSSKLRQHMPIIDAWTESKVTGFLIELGIK